MTDLTSSKLWDLRWRGNAKIREILISTREMDSLISKTLERIPVDGKVLELGIAPGRMVSRYNLIRKDLKYDGVDISEVGIRKTKEVYDCFNIDGELFLADIRSLDNLYGRYDLVVSHGLIEHFDNYEEIVRHHLDFVSINGFVLITIPNYSNTIVNYFLQKFSSETLVTHNVDCMSINALSTAVKNIGGEVVCSGRFGGPLLPHSVVNVGISGCLYNFFSKTWNFVVSIIDIIFKEKKLLRFWEGHIYVVFTGKIP